MKKDYITSMVPGIRSVPDSKWTADITPTSHIIEATHQNTLYCVARDPRDNQIAISSNIGEHMGRSIFGSYKALNISPNGVTICDLSAFYDGLIDKLDL